MQQVRGALAIVRGPKASKPPGKSRQTLSQTTAKRSVARAERDEDANASGSESSDAESDCGVGLLSISRRRTGQAVQTDDAGPFSDPDSEDDESEDDPPAVSVANDRNNKNNKDAAKNQPEGFTCTATKVLHAPLLTMSPTLSFHSTA